MTLDQFLAKLRDRLAALSADDIRLELSDYLPANELQGLETKIRVRLLLLYDEIEAG